MATPSGIRDTASTVKAGRAAVSSKNNTCDRTASSLSSSWKGETGEAYREAYKRVKVQASAVLHGYNSLNNKLLNLSNAVRRAEEEDKKAVAKK